jgi:hypothetical protein
VKRPARAIVAARPANGPVYTRRPRPQPQLYLPPAQVGSVSLNYIPKDLVVLARRTPMALMPGIREIVKRADVEQPLSSIRPLSDIVAAETAPRMTQLRMLAALSLIALLIAGIGIHGLFMFAVSQRAQELGVRRALVRRRAASSNWLCVRGWCSRWPASRSEFPWRGARRGV